jgi:hypothetical protein
LYISYVLFSVVWNIKSQEQRFVELSPDDTWGGAGLLGVTIRLDDYGGADERLIRVLTVEDNSPASIAGLVPLKDYLLGTTVTAFGSTQALATVLQYHVDQVVEIYVYNSDSDVVRVVALMPTYSWGGRGLLGAEVGTGYLHRLPSSSRATLGQSVERKVRWMGGGTNAAAPHDGNDDGNDNDDAHHGEHHGDDDQPLEIEPHLEMEVDQQQTRRPEEASKQPHELGKQDGTKKQQQQHNTALTNKKKPERNETVLASDQKTKPAEPPSLLTPATGDSTKESSSATPATMESPTPSVTVETVTDPEPATAPIMEYPKPVEMFAPPSAESSPVKPPPPTTYPQLMSPQQLMSPLTLSKSVSLEEAESLFSGPPPELSPMPVGRKVPAPGQGFNASFMPPPPKMHL